MEEIVRLKGRGQHDFGGFFSFADRRIRLRFTIHHYGMILGMNTMIVFCRLVVIYDKIHKLLRLTQ